MELTGSNSDVFKGMDLEIFSDGAPRQRRQRPSLKYAEVAREIPVFSQTDVLVIGGGPSGTAAAVAAGKLGADVTLVERYNHLGGLSTGGLVIYIDQMTDWNGKLIVAGFAEELFDRLPREAVTGPGKDTWGSRDAALAGYWLDRSASFQGIVTWSPTIDPEALKSLSMTMVLERKVRLLLHAWAVQPIIEGGVMRGAIFESKEGRQAILAKVVVDTSGDADLIARAGVAVETDVDSTNMHHCINTAFLLAGVDMDRWTEFRHTDTQGFADFMQRGRETLQFMDKPCFSWRPDIALFMGPRLSGYSAIDVEDLTEVEIRSRHLMDGHLAFYRAHAPGFENAYLMLSAPQAGVRHSRRFVARSKVTHGQWDEGKVWDDEIGVCASLAPKWPNISVPYASLVPIGVEGVLGAGRHVACDASSHLFLREIPQCWMTGQAAGVAAALAAGSGQFPRNLDPRIIQRELLKQGVYLSPSIRSRAGLVSAAAE